MREGNQFNVLVRRLVALVRSGPGRLEADCAHVPPQRVAPGSALADFNHIRKEEKGQGATAPDDAVAQFDHVALRDEAAVG